MIEIMIVMMSVSLSDHLRCLPGGGACGCDKGWGGPQCQLRKSKSHRDFGDDISQPFATRRVSMGHASSQVSHHDVSRHE